MAKNECGVDVPATVGDIAKQLGCSQGVRNIYRNGQYGGKRPVASIGYKRATRFQSNTFDDYKVTVTEDWVAFKSPSSVQRSALEGISPSLYSRIGETTRTKKIDGSPLVFRVEDEVVFLAPSNPKKAFCLQKIRLDDGQGIDKGHIEFRICYYMIIHKKGTWGFGQFAPMMTEDEMQLVVEKMKKKRWLQK